MAEIVKKLSEEVTCSICHEHYSSPKVLGCMHRYCRDCLHDYITSKKQMNGVTCPDCRRISRGPTYQGVPLPLEKWADSFPTDHLVGSLVDNLKTETKTSDVCRDHQDNPVVLFCKDCKKAVCHVCAGVDHRKCDSVVSLRLEADQERVRLKLHHVALREKKRVAEENCKLLETYNTDLYESYRKAVQKSFNYCKDVKKAVEQLEFGCMHRLRSSLAVKELNVTKCIDKQKRKLNETTVSEKGVSRALQSKSDVEILTEDFTKKYSIPTVGCLNAMRGPTVAEQRPAVAYDLLFGEIIKRARTEFLVSFDKISK